MSAAPDLGNAERARVHATRAPLPARLDDGRRHQAGVQRLAALAVDMSAALDLSDPERARIQAEVARFAPSPARLAELADAARQLWHSP